MIRFIPGGTIVGARTTRSEFPRYETKATFRWKEDGKNRQQTRTFSCTCLNSFNPISPDEAKHKVRQDVHDWLAECKKHGKPL